MFNEIPHSERQQYRRVKQKLKQLTKQRELVAREVQDHALACYEEWNRMKDSEPNAADVRATLQLNFTMSLMYSLPVTLVGLQIVVLEADFTDISTCFLLAALVSLLGGAVRVLKIQRPATLISTGLFLGLASALVMMDYRDTDTAAERAENVRKVKLKLIAGLAIASLGYTIGSIGLQDQIRRLVPRKLYLLYSGDLWLGQFLGAAVGSTWAISCTLLFESSRVTLLPFAAIACVLFIAVLTCLRNRLQPHWSYALKEQESLLKDHLLQKHLQ